MNKEIIKKLTPIFLVFVGIALGAFYFLVFQSHNESVPEDVLSAEDAGQKAIEYIVENFFNGDASASLLKTAEESGLYKIKFEIGGTEYDSYVSKDGKFLFPDTIDMEPPSLKEIPKTEVPKVQVFVMSFCPFGNQAEEIMMPVQNLLGDKADIELNYVIYSNYGSGYPEYCLDEENKYCSMHGIQELNQNVREICVQKYQSEKFWDFVKEINEKADYKNVDEKWESIAKDLGIDVEKVKKCQAEQGESLLAQELALNKISYPVQDSARHKGQEEITIAGSPTIVINGVVYDGDRSPDAYKEGVCSGFLNRPSECNQKLETESKAEGEC